MAADEVRSFIAIELPDEVKRALTRISDDLRKCGAEVSWVRPGSMHLTLKFLGPTPRVKLPEIRSSMETVFAAVAPFELRLKDVGCFPNLRKPRVIWVGCSDPQHMTVPLVGHIEDALGAIGFPKEDRSFSPHLTLGRVRGLRNSEELIDALRQKKSFDGPKFRVDHAVLFESILHPTGARYNPLARFALKSV
jgi:2'-5' RNA ligase